MKTNLAVLALLLGFVLTAHAVTDEEHIPWDGAHSLVGSNGIINPDVLVGFNPQPDPPADGAGAPLKFVDQNTASFTLSGFSNPQTFLFYFAVDLGGAELVMDTLTLPTGNFDKLTIGINSKIAENTFLHLLDAELLFGTSSGGIVDLASIHGFNPQPDPPSGFGAESDLGLSFSYTSLSDASVTLQLRDATGALMNLRSVPEPGSLALLGLGLVGLGAIRRKRS